MFTASERYRARVSDALEIWFAREILPYEGALVRYLARRRRQSGDIEDLRHDIYVRVLEAAAVARPSSPRAFLFTTARNLLIDRARHERIVPFEQLLDFDDSNVFTNEICAERQVSGWQQLQRLARLFDRLPARCREVFWKRRIEGCTTKEVASQLGMAEATVDKHLYNGLRLLWDAMHRDINEPEGTGHEQASAAYDE